MVTLTQQMIFLLNQSATARLKYQECKSWGKTLKNLIFFALFQQLKQKLGLEGRVALLYRKTL